MLYVFLAHLFITTVRRRLGEKKGLTLSLAQQLPAAALFAPTLDKADAINAVIYDIRRNEVAAPSHKKRTRAELQKLGFVLDTG